MYDTQQGTEFFQLTQIYVVYQIERNIRLSTSLILHTETKPSHSTVLNKKINVNKKNPNDSQFSIQSLEMMAFFFLPM